MDEVDSSPIAGILRKYRRDIACFIMAILAVLFCASEWFRVQGTISDRSYMPWPPDCSD